MRITKLLALIASLVVSSVFLTGCVSAHSSEGGKSSLPNQTRKIFQSISPLERTILSKLPVSLSSYNLAVQATISCLQGDGFIVNGPVLGQNGLYQYESSYSWGHGSDFNFHPTAKQAAKEQSELFGCEHLSSAVEAVYIYEHQSSVSEIEKAFGIMIACFDKYGMNIPSDSTLSNSASIAGELDTAIANHKISIESVDSCQKPFQAVDVQALPGVPQALANLNSQ